MVICLDQPYRAMNPGRRPKCAAPQVERSKGCLDTQVSSLGGPGSFTNAPMLSRIFPAFQQHCCPCWKQQAGTSLSQVQLFPTGLTPPFCHIQSVTCQPHPLALAKLHVLASLGQEHRNSKLKPARPSLFSGSRGVQLPVITMTTWCKAARDHCDVMVHGCLTRGQTGALEFGTPRPSCSDMGRRRDR